MAAEFKEYEVFREDVVEFLSNLDKSRQRVVFIAPLDLGPYCAFGMRVTKFLFVVANEP